MATIDELITERDNELTAVRAAISQIVNANATQSSYGNRSVTFVPLADLRQREKYCVNELNRLRGTKDSGGKIDMTFGYTVTINRKSED